MNDRVEYFRDLVIQYRIELVLFVVSLVTSGTALYTVLQSDTTPRPVLADTTTMSKPVEEKQIYIDVSGAVSKPGVYKLSPTARFKDAVDRAGGLTSEAASNFFGRNFNQAQILTDQTKIYIPSIGEVESGIYSELPKVIRISTDIKGSPEPQDENTIHKTNVNAASGEELANLPQIGPSLAQKIIQNRPYTSLESLPHEKL